MWCSNCQADVAAEVASGSHRARCATCGTEVGVGPAVHTSAKTEAARDLLKRWANDKLFDPFGPLPGLGGETKQPLPGPEQLAVDAHAASSGSPAANPAGQAAAAGSASAGGEFGSFRQSARLSRRDESPTADDKPESGAADRPPSETTEKTSHSTPVFRWDKPHSTVDVVGSSSEGRDRPQGSAPDTRDHPHQPSVGARRGADEPDKPTGHPNSAATGKVVHQAHGPQLSGPHFDVQSAIEEERLRNPNWLAFWGQILAYFGVAGLTVGTAMVLWGYFGGPSSYTPTGWLIATAGQMLLFLGVVTLISGGMEQTTEEVARRIDRLGAQLIRIERGSRDHALRGPHSRGDDVDDPVAQRSETGEPRQQHV